MGRFINIGNSNFVEALNAGFVDKSELISKINGTLRKKSKMTCVTRCRRFGKSTAADMLCAYYDKSCDSRNLFKGLSIENEPSFEEHLNKYRVIYISMTDFIAKYGHNLDIIEILKESIIKDTLKAFPDIEMDLDDDVMDLLFTIATEKGESFIMIIDEWDALCREFRESEVVDRYVDLLRRLFKGVNTSRVFAAAYITGILPIKRYNTQSALNNFYEYTMIAPGGMETYFGFTASEVAQLCEENGMDFDEMKKWYDGYRIGDESSMFNPNSVMQAIEKNKCGNYWSTTGAFDSVAAYIQMNYEGLKDDIVKMLAGGKCSVDAGRFSNDLNRIDNKDDVLTVLIHLGYLAYDPEDATCYIPNREVREEMERAVLDTNWHEVIDAINRSEELMQAVFNGDEKAVAAGVEQVHMNVVRIQSYNKEDSLSHVVTMAFYTAMKDYSIVREMPAGKGFADLIFIPHKNVSKPALLIELKYDKDAHTAIDQIHERQYPKALHGLTNGLILVGINYDPATKQHTCRIEPQL